MKKILFHSLNQFRPVHREDTIDAFGMNKQDGYEPAEGFEIYSSNGLKKRLDPMRSDFYKIALSLKGKTAITIGLEIYYHGINTVAFTMPDQVFSICNISEEVFGYYILFTAEFMNDLIKEEKLRADFPFYSDRGIPFFTISELACSDMITLFHKLDKELKNNLPERILLIKIGVLEMLVIAKREYERCIAATSHYPRKENNPTLHTYKKLVQKHFLEKRQVAAYAKMMCLTPNHLNRVIKETSGKTASHFIKEMLLLESKVLLRYSNLTISEIAWQLKFNDPSHFVNFFKKKAQQSPLQYRKAESLQ
jgi:AraC family transcriptional regulator, transcriptional activator of pobA